MLVKRIDPFVAPSSKARRLTKAPKYLLFDLGIRRLGAKEGSNPSLEHQGHLLEQFVGLELFAFIETLCPSVTLSYWRDHDGPEVDYVLTYENHYIPIEVKLSKNPSSKDLKHLKLFQEEYQQTDPACLIAGIDRPMLLEDGFMRAL